MSKIEQLRKVYRYIRLAQLELEQCGYQELLGKLNPVLMEVAEEGKRLKELETPKRGKQNELSSVTQKSVHTK